MDSSLQLINVTDSCAILAGDFHTDPLLRGIKHDWTPPWGEGEKLWPDWKGSAGQESRLLLVLGVTASTDQKAALQLLFCHRGETFHFPVCALAPPQSHTSSWQEVLCIPKTAKLNHHARISTQPKLLHMLKIYKGRQRVKRSLFLNASQKRF